LTTDNQEMFECVIPLPDALIRKPMGEPSKSVKHGDHDQSDHGNWADGSGDGSKDNPIRTNSVEDAARALGEGKHVELRTPDQVATLLDRLNELAKEAEAAGSKAKNIDLCQLTVPGTNLFCVESKGIPRVEMPQLKGIPNSGSPASDLPADKRGEVDITEAYLERLRSSGVALTEDEALASHLKATQNELNGGKVAGIMQAARAGEIDLNQSIVVSKDGYIVDGHHRWAAKVALEHDGIDDPETDMKIPVVRVDQDILEILESSKQFAADMGLPQMAVKSLKHGDHDQSDHGSWAHGGGFDKITAAERKDFNKTVAAALNDLIEKNDKAEEGNKVVNWAVADRHGWSNEDVAVLRMYTGQGANDINESLRGDYPKQGIHTIYEQAAMTETLDRMLASGGKLPQDMMVYRGMSFEDEKAAGDVLGQWKPGQVWTDPGFGSTSVHRNTAQAFANGFLAGGGETQVLWEISAPKGNSGFPMWNLFTHPAEQEGEILFPRDAHYRIDSVESKSGNPDGFAKQIVTIKATMLADNSVKSMKHGDHDQSDHGNWATGGADHQYTGKPRSAASRARMGEHTDRYGDPERRESGRRSGSRNLGREVTYMEIVALESYKGGGYGEINRFLRGTQEGDDWTKDRIDAVKSLALPTTEPMTVTRMMPLFAVEGIAAGQIYEDKGFMSTGKGDRPAQFFHGYPVQMQIEVPAGTPVVDFDNFTGLDGWGNIEREVTLMPNSQLIIDRVEQRNWNRDFGPTETDGLKIYARLVPPTKSVKHADHDQSDHGSWADGSVPIAKTPIEQVDSLRQWSSNSYNMVNGALRNPDTLGAQERGGVREMYQKTQDGLDRLFAGVPKTTEEMTVYRGATGDWVKDLVDRYEAMIEKGRVGYRETGEVPQFSRHRFTDQGFTSTTPDRDIALRFSGTGLSGGGYYTGEGRAIFEINIPEGSSVVNVEEFANEFGGFATFAAEEKEYLLPRGSTFEVADVTPSEEQFGSQGPLYYTIRLDLVPAPTKSLKHADHDQSDHGSWAENREQIEKEDAERAKNDPWRDSPVSRSDAYASMAHYADFGYIPINRFLRGSDGDRPFSTKDKILQDVKNIDAMFTVATPLEEDLKVFRGVSYEQGSEMIAGRIFTDAGYTSTSRNAITPFGFMDETAGRQYMMEITVPAGSKVAQVELSNEAETLLPRGSQFMITGLRNDGITIVEATLINSLKSYKHADHDQSDHGSWADGEPAEGKFNEAENGAITIYTDQGHMDINGYLRTGYLRASNYGGSDDVVRWIENLDAAIESAGPTRRDMTIFRGVSERHLQELIDGGVLKDPGFASFTKDGEIASSFARGVSMGYSRTDGAVLELDLPAGSAALDMFDAGIPNEQEVLLPRDSRFELISGPEELDLSNEEQDENNTVPVYQIRLVSPAKSYKHADHDQSDHGNWATGGGVLTRNAERFKAAGGTIDKPVKATDSPRSDYATPTGLYGGGSGVRAVIWHWDDLVNKAVAADDARTKAEEANMNLWETTKLDIESPEYEKESDKFQKAFEEADRLALGYKLTVDAITSTPFNEVIVARGADGSIVGALAYYMPPDNSQFTVQLLGSTHEVSGTGTALMREAMGIALDKGVPFQVLDPVKDAQSWYESLGLGPLQMSDGDVYHASKPLYRVEPDALREILGTTKSLKHGDHDQSDHGNWATGSEFRSPSSEDRGRTPKGSATSTPYAAHYYDTQQRQRLDMALDAYTHWKPENSGDTEADRPFHAVLNENLRNGMNRGKAVEAASAEFATGDEKDDEATANDLYEGFMSLDSATQNSRMMEDTVVTRASSPIIYLDELEAAAAGGSLNLYGFDISQGAVFSDAGFVSTSLDTTGQSTQYFANRWDTEGLDDNQIPTSVRWNITVPEGAPALDLRALEFGSQHGEQEVILPRNTHFQVDSWDVQLPKFEGRPASVTINATVIPTHAKP